MSYHFERDCKAMWDEDSNCTCGSQKPREIDLLNVGALKKLLEHMPDHAPVEIQIQPSAEIGKVTGIWGPTEGKPALTLVAVAKKTSQKTQPLY